MKAWQYIAWEASNIWEICSVLVSNTYLYIAHILSMTKKFPV